MSYLLVDQVFDIEGLDPTDSWVLAAICRHVSKQSPHPWPSVALLCKETRYKTRAVKDSIKHLAMHGFIEIESRPGTSNLYQITISEGVPCSTRTKCLRPEKDEKDRTRARRARPVVHQVHPNQLDEQVTRNRKESSAPRARPKKRRRRSVDSPSAKRSERSERSNTQQQGGAPRARVHDKPCKDCGLRFCECSDLPEPEIPFAAFANLKGEA
jgi:hypothetical protein